MGIEYICDYYVISRKQRKEEISRGLGKEGTIGYENSGCYDCSGKDINCDNYQTILKLKEDKE